MAATNKCLAQSNKSRTGAQATTGRLTSGGMRVAPACLKMTSHTSERQLQKQSSFINKYTNPPYNLSKAEATKGFTKHRRLGQAAAEYEKWKKKNKIK
jgi:hypothetical protein